MAGDVGLVDGGDSGNPIRFSQDLNNKFGIGTPNVS
jgi:hypothetical protein